MDLQALLDRERALAACPAYGPDAERFMLEEVNRLQAVRLASDVNALQPRTSFTHTLGMHPPTFSPHLMKCFPAINRKYFVEIFRGTFKVEDLHKLSNDYLTKPTIGDGESSASPTSAPASVLRSL